MQNTTLYFKVVKLGVKLTTIKVTAKITTRKKRVKRLTSNVFMILVTNPPWGIYLRGTRNFFEVSNKQRLI